MESLPDPSVIPVAVPAAAPGAVVPRLSRIAVAAGVVSALVLGLFACVFGLGTLAVGGVPLFGILALLVWVPAAALVFLVLSVLCLGLSAAAAAHVRERAYLYGLPWTVFGRVAGGVGVAVSLVILIGTVTLPSFLIQQESIAWRQTANRGIASFEATSAKLGDIDASLQKGLTALQAMAPDASALDRARLAGLFAEQTARLQAITESLIVQSRSWQTALQMTLRNNGANAADAAKWMGTWLQGLWGKPVPPPSPSPTP
ncbi:hypothetical protein SAMN05444156_1208 [Verrucomicrobium sp. GAS474]|uniref:hypothetical protein n=1 Tax=Verrucomicrobium sp. GAS474 TaxID=1882831 RepID=UPI00087A9DB1|nr:hypothetical protein [Verrucomicrobium sp. GAS474]SDT97789.1 hypothetical protein SAMN05444156_1208 [Verrucomicrobium sp. GAS474]